MRKEALRVDAQLKRGILEICALKVLEKGDSYGYQIIKDLSPAVEISESTLYPILKRLEGDGCVGVYSVEHNGRLRRYYSITPAGRARISEFLSEWVEIDKIYRFIREGV
jgi:PadR family transcriptional regulator PadR